MENADKPTPSPSKLQSAAQPEQTKSFEITFNGDLLLNPFWEVVQAVLTEQISKGKLHALGMGTYGCSKSEHAELKTALDAALSTFGTKNL